MEPGLDTVLSVLETAGFERLPRPLMISGSAFEFDEAVRGTGTSHDLVVIATRAVSSRRLVRLMTGLSRTLDQVKSRRPVSLILLGEPPDGSTMAQLERHARVLSIENNDPEPEQVRQAIAILTPLELPSATSRGDEPLAEVTKVLDSSLSREHLAFIDAAKVGPEMVRESLRRYIDDAAHGEDEGNDS